MESEEKPLNENKIDLKKFRHKYSVDFKLEILYKLNAGISLHSIEKNMNLDRGMIRRWKKNESFLRGIKNKGKRYRKNRIGGINKTMSEDEEEEICKFIKEARENKKAIGTKSVVAFAGSINSSFNNKTIHTQLMCCYRFIKRHDSSIRRISHVGQQIPENINTLKEAFKNEIIFKKINGYSL